MELFQNHYCTLLYDTETQILDQLWTSDTQKMTAEEYKFVQLKTVFYFVQQKAKRIYVDFKNFRWAIVPKIQVWTAENIIAALIEAGIVKISYIVPLEMIAELSMQQTLEEDETKSFPYEFFSDEKQARQWLCE